MNINIKEKYYDLLKRWCDKLIEMQVKDENAPDYLKGGIICPSCKMIHGRIADSVYPLIYLYDKTRDLKYLQSAELLFKWSENMLADDGSYYNDAQNEWNGITVFFVSMLARTLIYHGSVLPDQLKIKFENRLKQNIKWIMTVIDADFGANINYQAAAAEAIALCWKYFGVEEYKEYARERAKFCISYFNEEGFFTGESHPLNYLSERGLKGIDMGYNLEESLPALYECAEILEMDFLKYLLVQSARVHRRFLLPDGGMDNSFGSRNYKWTYWGSRTSDSYLAMFEMLGKEDASFLKYKYTAFDIYDACTEEGLLYGGPDYKKHGELPCIHHTFCKMKAIAALLDVGITDTTEQLILTEKPMIYHYESLLSDQIFNHGFYALITTNDVFYLRGGHVSGGTISLLWHKITGPIIAASMIKYSLYEVTNSQLSLSKRDMGKMSLRFERKEKDVIYASDQDFTAVAESTIFDDCINVVVRGWLADIDGNKMTNGQCEFQYTFKENTIAIHCKPATEGTLCLPIISSKVEKVDDNVYLFDGRNSGKIKVTANGSVIGVKPVFNLICGFTAFEIDVKRDEEGNLGILMEVQGIAE